MTIENNNYDGEERRKIQRRVKERRAKIRFKDALGRRSGQDRRSRA